jgi:hypothetical protein
MNLEQSEDPTGRGEGSSSQGRWGRYACLGAGDFFEVRRDEAQCQALSRATSTFLHLVRLAWTAMAESRMSFILNEKTKHPPIYLHQLHLLIGSSSTILPAFPSLALFSPLPL